MPFINEAAKEKLIDLFTEEKIDVSVKDWKNFTGNIEIFDAVIIKIKTPAQHQIARQLINQFNKEFNRGQIAVMRDAAGGLDDKYSQSYSMTPCAAADVIMYTVGDLNVDNNIRSIKALDKKNHIYEVGANVTVEEVDNFLYNNMNSVLPTASLIGKVTLIGLLSNSGHGTGINQPAVAGLVEGMTFCLPNGELLRILPPDADGIEKEIASRDGIKTLRHPDFYDIRGSSLGLFGTLISVDVRCMAAHKMQTVREPRSLSGLIEEISKGLLTKNDYTCAMVVPKYTSSTQPNICIRKQTPVPRDTPDANFHPHLEHLEQKILLGTSEFFGITDILSCEKDLIPFTMDQIAKTQVPDHEEIEVGDWPDQVHFQKEYYHDLDNFDFLFEASLSDSHEVNDALKKMEELKEKYAKQGQYVIVFVGFIRAFKGTAGGLSTSQASDGKYIVGFDIVSNRGIEGYFSFKNEMMDYFINELKAKPHWGKTVPFSYIDKQGKECVIDYREMYGHERFDKFKNILTNWYKRFGDFTLENNSIINNFWKAVLQVQPRAELQLVESYSPAVRRDSRSNSYFFFHHNRNRSQSSAQIVPVSVSQDLIAAVKPSNVSLFNAKVEQKQDDKSAAKKFCSPCVVM